MEVDSKNIAALCKQLEQILSSSNESINRDLHCRGSVSARITESALLYVLLLLFTTVWCDCSRFLRNGVWSFDPRV